MSHVFACAPVLVFLCFSLAPRIGWADFIGHGAPVRDIVISPDGAHALTAGFDDQIIYWDTQDGHLISRLIGHEAAVNAVAFLGPDHTRAVSVSDDATLRFWDLASGAELMAGQGHEKKVVGVAVSPDGTLVASASWDRTVRLWDAASGQELAVWRGHRNSVNAVAFLPDGSAVISVGYDGEIWAWPLANQQEPEPEPERLASIGFPINDMALSGDGGWMITASSDQTLRLVNLESRQVEREFSGHDGAVLAVSLSPDGSTFASGGADGFLLLWDLDGTIHSRLGVSYRYPVWSLAFSPDGALIYAGGIDQVARAWVVATGAPALSGETTPFQPVARVDPSFASSDDPFERGAYQFRKCAICHSIQDDGIARAGPPLVGLFGREVGTYPGYVYSQSLLESDLIWNEHTIAQLFDVGPDRLLPGTKMPLQRLSDPQARDDLVEYLRVVTQPQ